MRSGSTVERACELAKSGRCSSVSDIRTRLKQERWESVDAHLAGPSFARQLRDMIALSRASEPAA